MKKIINIYAKMLTASVAIFVITPGCASKIKYKEIYSYVSENKCSDASNYILKNKKQYGSNNKLNFYLDAATINMICGNFELSNKYFHKAETLAEFLWTKSISRASASFFFNEYSKPYPGEDFERALINLFSALNYITTDKTDDALVEVRRLDSLLSVLNSKYSKKNIYREDAFGRYLSGILYEVDKSYDDAFIDYFKAFNIYKDYYINYRTKIPDILVEDLVLASKKADRFFEIESLDRVKSYVKQTKNSTSTYKNSGKLVVIHLNGKSPDKIEGSVRFKTKNGPIKIAFPKYNENISVCRSSNILVSNDGFSKDIKSFLVEDIEKIAVKNLKDRETRIIAKAMARAAVKQIVFEVAASQIKDKAAKQMTKFVLNTLNQAILEKADIRSWKTLPGQIFMSRVFLPEGVYNIKVNACNGNTKRIKSVVIKKNKTKFVLAETMF